eukprot:Lankesteria_metandrocarpae@DN4216_c0_g1_i2.p1
MDCAPSINQSAIDCGGVVVGSAGDAQHCVIDSSASISASIESFNTALLNTRAPQLLIRTGTGINVKSVSSLRVESPTSPAASTLATGTPPSKNGQALGSGGRGVVADLNHLFEIQGEIVQAEWAPARSLFAFISTDTGLQVVSSDPEVSNPKIHCLVRSTSSVSKQCVEHDASAIDTALWPTRVNPRMMTAPHWSPSGSWLSVMWRFDKFPGSTFGVPTSTTSPRPTCGTVNNIYTTPGGSSEPNFIVWKIERSRASSLSTVATTVSYSPRVVAYHTIKRPNMTLWPYLRWTSDENFCCFRSNRMETLIFYTGNGTFGERPPVARLHLDGMMHLELGPVTDKRPSLPISGEASSGHEKRSTSSPVLKCHAAVFYPVVDVTTDGNPQLSEARFQVLEIAVNTEQLATNQDHLGRPLTSNPSAGIDPSYRVALNTDPPTRSLTALSLPNSRNEPCSSTAAATKASTAVSGYSTVQGCTVITTVNRVVPAADSAVFKWSPSGNCVLVETSTLVDSAGENYAGVGDVYFCRKDDAESVVGVNSKVAQDVAWSPTRDEFILIEGISPSDITLYDRKCEAKFKFPPAYRNTVRWDPTGSIVAIGGFANLAGDLSFWYRNAATQSMQLIAEWREPCTVLCGWAPTGMHFFTASTRPRRKVDNCLKIFTYEGRCVVKKEFEVLYKVAWNDDPLIAYKTPPQPEFRGQLGQQVVAYRPRAAVDSHVALEAARVMRGDAEATDASKKKAEERKRQNEKRKRARRPSADNPGEPNWREAAASEAQSTSATHSNNRIGAPPNSTLPFTTTTPSVVF